MKRYRTILTIRPWMINQTGTRGASQHYPLMTLEAIKDLPVGQLAEPDAPMAVGDECRHLLTVEVMQAWGFVYKGCLTWVKPGYRLGWYLRNATEHLLLGVRGQLPMGFHGQASWTFAPTQDHSHKPEEQYAIIERCSPGPRLELFARRRPPGLGRDGERD